MGFNVAFANISYALCKFDVIDVTDVDVALMLMLHYCLGLRKMLVSGRMTSSESS